MDTAVFVLAGGAGTRLWPLSRKMNPKQFLPIGKDGRSFFEMTVLRALKLTDESHVFIMAQSEYHDFVESQAAQIPKENIFYEAEKKNTAPAIATAMMKVNTMYKDVISVVLPADHYICSEDEFLNTVKTAVGVAENRDSFITIGITPTRPDTSFGYIKCGEKISDEVYKTSEFREKPDSKKALEYISNGSYFWNSGIIVGKNSFIIGQFKKYLPEVFCCAEKICASSNKEEADNLYKNMPNISVDYGVLEKTSDILLINGRFGWDDIGSWNALDRLYTADENGNVLVGNGLIIDAKNSTVISDGSFTVTSGVEGLFVINTGDAVLVCSKQSYNTVLKNPKLTEDKRYKNLL